jgi:hypothetical protein
VVTTPPPWGSRPGTAPAGAAPSASVPDPGPVSSDLTAVVLALAGIRRGHVVLDLTPGAGIGASAAAAAGEVGLVVAVQPRDKPLPAGVRHSVASAADATTLPSLRGARISRVLVVAPHVEARTLEPALSEVLPLLAPGARVTAVARANTSGSMGEGLPGLLAALGLQIVHAEGIDDESGPLAVTVAVPQGYGSTGAPTGN